MFNPILMLLALGFGLGSQISDTSSLGTEDYLHFVGPGVLAGTAVLQGGLYSLWPTMAQLRWEGTYQPVIRTPCSPLEVAVGHLLWVGLRVTFSSAFFLLVLLLGIGWSGFLALAAAPLAGLTAIAVAAPVAAFCSRQETDLGFSFVSRMILTPLFVFSGTFTLVESLPSAVQAIVKVTPGYHGIEIVRGLINDTISAAGAASHVGVLLLWVVVGGAATISGFRKALTP